MDDNFFIVGTSLVNFCEQDFYYNFIGEPINVISSLAISFFGFYGLYKLSLIQNIDIDISITTYKYYSKILYLILILIGFGSVYFHWELSHFAHWIDIILISIILIFSNYCLELKYNCLTTKIKYLLIFIVHLISSLKIPSIHIFFQFITGFYIQKQIENKLILIKNNILNENYLNILNKYKKIKMYFILSLFLWILDYFFCEKIKLYHTHWIFHILIGYISYKIIDLIKFIYYSESSLKIC